MSEIYCAAPITAVTHFHIPENHHKGTNPAKKWALPKLLNADDDNDGCNDNYDGNFDDDDNKNDQITYKY